MSGAIKPENQQSDYLRHILRRETHSARSGAAIVAAILVAAGALYCLLEMTLGATGQDPWLLHPLDAAQRAAGLPGATPTPLLAAAGALLALLGLIFLCNGLLPGRRARHIIVHPRVAIAVDDEVVASALAKRARMAAGVTREQVMVIVSARTVQVNIRPTSGRRLSEEHIKSAVEAELEAMALEPTPTVHIKLAESGVIGV